jgi:hypothetical protein
MLGNDFQPAQLRSCGVAASALRACGCSACELKSAGFSLRELQLGGFSARELKDAGYVPQFAHVGMALRHNPAVSRAGFSAVSFLPPVSLPARCAMPVGMRRISNTAAALPAQWGWVHFASDAKVQHNVKV